MNGSFTVSLFEILNYLVPGFLIILGFGVYSKELQKIVKNSRYPQSGLFATVIALSFLIGVINHAVSSASFTKAQALVKISRVDDYISEYKNIEQVRNKINRVLNDTTNYSNFFVYRYAYTYVKENSQSEIIRIERLSALSIFCRNSALPLLFFFSSLAITLYRKRILIGFIKWTIFISVALISEVFLIKAYDDYLLAKMISIFRTF